MGGADSDVAEGAEGVRAICSAAALHLAQAEEVNGQCRRKVGRVHSVGGGEAEEAAAMGDREGAADTSDGEGVREWSKIVE